MWGPLPFGCPPGAARLFCDPKTNEDQFCSVYTARGIGN